MALVNRATNEVTVKLVYYGPGLCGKTTNLEKIYGNPKLSNKGKMISMATETDRTLFFDFMPMELGEIGGKKIRVQLYTVPGQVFYDATRKLVLRGADGVVFVADSQSSMKESNIESLENLYTNLRLNKLDPEKIALVFQLNKRDLPNIAPVEEMTAYLGPRPGVAVVEAAAINAVGVTQTMRAAVAAILNNLKNNVDISLPAEEVAEPEAETDVAAAVEVEPEATAVEIEPEAPVVEPVVEAEDAPVEVIPDASAFAPDAEADVSPFESAGSALRDELLVPIEESPFDETRPASKKPAPAEEAPFADFHEAEGDSAGDEQLEAMLTRAEALVQELEATLARAKAQVDEIAAKLRG